MLSLTGSFVYIVAGDNVTISENPVSKHVRLGEQVTFTCAIHAQSRSKVGIRWHLRAPAFGEDKDRFLKLPKLQQKWSKRGIMINYTSAPPESFPEYFIRRDTITFIATMQMNGASIECAAIDHDTEDFNIYSNSMFAMLTIESEGVSGAENSSFTRPENTTAGCASEMDTSRSNSSPRYNSSPHTLWFWIMLSLIPGMCKI